MHLDDIELHYDGHRFWPADSADLKGRMVAVDFRVVLDPALPETIITVHADAECDDDTAVQRGKLVFKRLCRQLAKKTDAWITPE